MRPVCTPLEMDSTEGIGESYVSEPSSVHYIPCDVVKLDVVRSGQQIGVSVTLGQKPG